MSVSAPPRSGARLGEALASAEELAVLPASGDAGAIDDAGGGPEGQALNPLLTTLAAVLSAAAAGWLVGGVFTDGFARIVGVGGAVLGGGMVAMSYRTSRPSVIQYLTPVAALAIGGPLMAADATGGTANLPGLVAEALRTGGLSDPPVPFDPGWKLLLVVITSLVCAGASGVAVASGRPKLGVFIPVPLTFGALLIQPPGTSIVHTIVALILVAAGLAVSFGVELEREGATSGRFEFRRLVRGVVMVVVLVAALTALTRVGFLFPEERTSQIVPPKRPEAPPPQKDRPLFEVRTDRSVPWRLGVLDGYDGEAFLLPPFDTGRLMEIPADGGIPYVEAAQAEVPGTPPRPPTGADADGVSDVMTVEFRVKEIGGHVVPTIANATSMDARFTIEWDPRTQALRLPDRRARDGMTYTVLAPVPPGAAELREVAVAPKSMGDFLKVPAPPLEISDLLSLAPQGNPYERLQFVRNELYANVVAAGAGDPVPVPPARVVELLRGAEASPFEIAAAEALLARWAGVPSRIGYGYYRGNELSRPGHFQVRPEHGSSWLEVYFDGYGWVPIVGQPLKARSSLSSGDKNEDPTVKPSEEISVPVYVPVALDSLQRFFVLARYWVARSLPPLAAGALAMWMYPALLKLLRSIRRRRWIAQHGLQGRVAVAYSSLRDEAADSGVGESRLTPLQFTRVVADDAEHRELAWLVTRSIWGDLARDLREEDARVAEELAKSVARRMRQARSPWARVTALASRRSLRTPYNDEIPNAWLDMDVRGRIVRVGRRARSAASLRGLRRWLWGRRARSALALAMAVVVAAVLGAGCARSIDTQTIGSEHFPDPVAPENLLGFRFERKTEAEAAFVETTDKALVNGGRVYAVAKDDAVVGLIQIASFKPGALAREREVRQGVLDSIGRGQFALERLGSERVYTLDLPEQRLLLWFAPSGEYYQLFVSKAGLAEAEDLFLALLAYQGGQDAVEIQQAPDWRRGSDG